MKSNHGVKNDCCDSFMSFNTDNSLTCNECGNEWLTMSGGLGGSSRRKRLRGLVRLTLLRNRHKGPMTSAQIREYIRGMKYRNSPSINQISNFCSSDPYIVRTNNVSLAEWKIIFDEHGGR
jgi:hypothetical protein